MDFREKGCLNIKSIGRKFNVSSVTAMVTVLGVTMLFVFELSANTDSAHSLAVQKNAVSASFVPKAPMINTRTELFSFKKVAKTGMSKREMQRGSSSQLEPLSAVSFSGDKIRASVLSYGCTHSTDFSVQYSLEKLRVGPKEIGLDETVPRADRQQEHAGRHCQLSIVRLKPDLCRRAPFVANVEIDFSLPEECTDLPVTVANPLLLVSNSNTLIKRIK